MCESAGAAIAGHLPPGGFNDNRGLSHSSGVRKSRRKVLWDQFILRAVKEVCPMLTPLSAVCH